MTDSRTTRRHVLATSGSLLGAVALAGCQQDDDGDGETTTAGETTTTDGATTADETQDGSDEETTDEEVTETTVEGRPTDVSFDAPHGATIEGTLYGSGTCGVVLVPQVNLDRGSWEADANRLAEQEGLTVLAIDEDPDDRASSVRGAMQYLREQHDVSSLVLVGASSGAVAVVAANANSEEGAVDGTIALSPGGGEEYASELQGRTLFVVSEADDERFVRVTKKLHEDAPHPSELITYEGSAHGQRILESAHGDDLRTRIQEFTASACSGESA